MTSRLGLLTETTIERTMEACDAKYSLFKKPHRHAFKMPVAGRGAEDPN